MKNTFRIIIVIIPIIYGMYFCFVKEEIEINFGDEEFTIIGVVDDYPEKRISSNRYRIKIKSINEINVNDNSRLLIVTEPYTEYHYGDELKITSTIEKPKDFITDSGKTFDYDNYLKLSKIYGIVREPTIEVLGINQANKIKSFLFKIRTGFANKINASLSYNSASLTRGILLGEKSDMTNEFRLNLSRSSTSHIIALSGYNMTIVSETIMKILSSFSILVRSLFGSLGILAFLVLAGGASSAVRASIMSLVLIYARARGLEYNNLYALFLATSLLILISPLSLRYDVGFHLSVLATFGLIAYQGTVAGYFVKKRFGKFLSETLSSTISASIMTLPYIAYSIGIISSLGIIANIIIVPMIPVLMLFGFVLGITPEFLRFIPAFVTENISNLMIYIINKIGETTWSAYYVENFPLVIVLTIYVFLFYKGFKLLQKTS